MIKQKNKSKYDNWINERIANGNTFKYTNGVLFSIECVISARCVETGEEFSLEYSEPKSKLKFAPELVKQVRLNMFKKDLWFKARNNKKSDKICGNCGKFYEHMDSDIALMFVTGQINRHVCFECGTKYIELGAEDIEKKINEAKAVKDSWIEKIKDIKPCNITSQWFKNLSEKTPEQLESIFNKMKAEKEESDRIEAIVVPEVEMEEYLLKEYGVVESRNYLKCEEQIEEYFKDDSYDLFDCGQGYSQDEASAICKIGDKFYNVLITAEIGSSKQDRGDRLYWVENIDKVTWKEIDKPLPKEKLTFSYSFTLSKDDKSILDSYLNERNFKHK